MIVKKKCLIKLREEQAQQVWRAEKNLKQDTLFDYREKKIIDDEK